MTAVSGNPLVFHSLLPLSSLVLPKARSLDLLTSADPEPSELDW